MYLDIHEDLSTRSTTQIYARGVFALSQRYEHQLDGWRKIPDLEQEKIIGRTKTDSIELSDDEKPATAHISRVVIEENGEELQMVRHSLPFGKPSGPKGLYFIGYTKDVGILDKMLVNMFEPADGVYDRLLDFTQTKTGAYFFVPPVGFKV